MHCNYNININDLFPCSRENTTIQYIKNSLKASPRCFFILHHSKRYTYLCLLHVAWKKTRNFSKLQFLDNFKWLFQKRDQGRNMVFSNLKNSENLPIGISLCGNPHNAEVSDLRLLIFLSSAKLIPQIG